MDIDFQAFLASATHAFIVPVELVVDRVRKFLREADEDTRDLEDRHW